MPTKIDTLPMFLFRFFNTILFFVVEAVACVYIYGAFTAQSTRLKFHDFFFSYKCVIDGLKVLVHFRRPKIRQFKIIFFSVPLIYIYIKLFLLCKYMFVE